MDQDKREMIDDMLEETNEHLEDCLMEFCSWFNGLFKPKEENDASETH